MKALDYNAVFNAAISAVKTLESSEGLNSFFLNQDSNIVALAVDNMEAPEVTEDNAAWLIYKDRDLSEFHSEAMDKLRDESGFLTPFDGCDNVTDCLVKVANAIIDVAFTQMIACIADDVIEAASIMLSTLDPYRCGNEHYFYFGDNESMHDIRNKVKSILVNDDIPVTLYKSDRRISAVMHCTNGSQIKIHSDLK